MTDSPKTWLPSIRSRLALLGAELEQQRSEFVELRIDDIETETHLGLDQNGTIWIRIVCDPRSVTTDDLSAAVTTELRPTGYRIVVTSNADRGVSAHFLEEVVDLLRGGHPPGDVGRAALQQWRELLARPPGALMGDQAVAGLFGELDVLRSVLHAGGSIDDWTGWERDHVDFRLPRLALEVKSTTSPHYRRVRVHGLRQLADPEDGSALLLVLRRLEPSPNGESVPELIEAIVQVGASRSQLLDRLSRVGYFETHRHHYELKRFVSEELAVRRVDDSHPRLTPGLLDHVDLTCIDRIDYELNLSGDIESDLDEDLDALIAAALGAP